MRELILNGLEIGDIASLHTLFARGLDLPAWYGRNLDALYDCLSTYPEPVCIRLENVDVLMQRLNPRGHALMRLMHRAAAENPNIVLAPGEAEAEK